MKVIFSELKFVLPQKSLKLKETLKMKVAFVHGSFPRTNEGHDTLELTLRPKLN